MSTLDLYEAAQVSKCHPETLRRMMKAGEAPGTKIGRAWVVSAELLQQWINNRCLCTDAPVLHTGGSALAARLAAARAQRNAQKRKNSKLSSANDSGVGKSSATVVQFRGQKRANDG